MEGRAAGATMTAREERSEERTVDRLARQVKSLKNRFDRVAKAAKRREEDFGTVRSQSAQVSKLREEVRELTQTVQGTKRQLDGLVRENGRLRTRVKRLESRRPDTTPAPREEVRPLRVVEQAPTRRPKRDPGRTFGQAAGRVPTEQEIRDIARREAQEALAGRNIADLIAEVQPGLGAKIQKLSPLLRKLGIDLDAGEMVTAVIDAILDRIDLDQIIREVVSKLQSRSRNSRY